MMRYSVLPHRAALRADALMDSWARSLKYVRSLLPAHPVVLLPTEAQALLEGQVFHALDVLYHVTGEDRARKFNISEMLEVTRLRAEPERLLIDVVPHGLARTLGIRLFPWRESGPGTPVHSPDLRVRPVSHGVEVYRPGMPGSVQFRGISMGEVMAEHREICPVGKCLAELSPRAITTAESTYGYRPPRESALALSAVVRRLGILRTAGADAIDSWALLAFPPGSAIAVEVWFPHLDSAMRESVLEKLSSVHLSPRWSIDPWIGGTGEHIESYFHIRSSGNHADIQLRLVDRNWIDRARAEAKGSR